MFFFFFFYDKIGFYVFFFFSSRRRHTRSLCDWSSDVCSSDLPLGARDSRELTTVGAVEEAPMAIVAGFDVHRAQITFDALDRETGEVHRGRIPASPEAVAGWVTRFPDASIHVAVEAGTGWLFVCEALAEAGVTAHLAE